MAELLSIVIPARNEREALPLLLSDLAPLRSAGAEIIVVDGGSTDGTPERVAPLVDKLLQSAPGRARQMNAGAAAASGEYLWFVHADTRVSAAALQRLLDTLRERPLWGRFDVRLSGGGASLRLIATMINLRSRLTGVASGDQAIFIKREAFAQHAGFADIALMEDIELSRRMKRLQRPVCLRPALLTSSRRWETNGVWRTVWLMWRLRLAYYCGANPDQLARDYQRGSRS